MSIAGSLMEIGKQVHDKRLLGAIKVPPHTRG